MSQKILEYTNGEITVVWKPEVCIHSAVCFHGLPGVFDPRRRPWIELDQSTTPAITAQIEKCPSGALSYYNNEAVSESLPE